MTSAAAAPSASPNCPAQGTKYPPGPCEVFFDHSGYHAGDVVSFAAYNVFDGDEGVTVQVTCGSTTIAVPNATSSTGGSVAGSFTLPPGTPAGPCTVTLTGSRSGVQVTGNVQVLPPKHKHHHHHHHKHKHHKHQ